MRPLLTFATLFAFAAMPAHAGRVAIHVVDGDGKPVPDAVIGLAPGPGTATRAVVPTTRYVDQKDETFLPYVTVLHPGDGVVFRNGDTTRHQVYSTSDIATFEYVLAPGERSDPLVIASPGAVAVGCHIHDRMIAYLYVTRDPDIAITDAKGVATLDGLPAGAYEAHVWHPRIRIGIAIPRLPVNIVEGSSATGSFTIALLPDPHGGMDRGHPGY